MVLERDVNAGIISTFADQISVPGRDINKDTPQEPMWPQLKSGVGRGRERKGGEDYHLNPKFEFF